MSKFYRGNHKSKSLGWDDLGVVGSCDNINWFAYAKAQNNMYEWVNIKVVAEKMAYGKANYRLFWNGSRFAKGGDHSKLMEHRSELLEKLELFMLEKNNLLTGPDLEYAPPLPAGPDRVSWGSQRWSLTICQTNPQDMFSDVQRPIARSTASG